MINNRNASNCLTFVCLFSRNNEKPIEVKSMPGVVQYGVSNIEECLKPIVNKGLKSVLIFGVVHGIPKVGDYHYFFKVKILSYPLKPSLFQIKDSRLPHSYTDFIKARSFVPSVQGIMTVWQL